MSALDAVLMLAALAAALVGYRRGLLVGVLSLVGLLAGAACGSAVGPAFVRPEANGAERMTVLVGAVIVLAVLFQIGGVVLGGAIRRSVLGSGGRQVDRAGGAVFGAGAMLTIAWLAGSAVASASSFAPALAGPVERSEVLRFVDGVMPARADVVYGSLSRALRQGTLPTIFSAGQDDPDENASADPAVSSTPAVAAAAGSVVRVRGAAPSCGREVTGSGFVYAPQRVLTNAHVVAGVRSPTVQIGGKGRLYRAVVVLFDPSRDVAVLQVPDLDAPALAFDASVEKDDDLVVAGFPLGGPYEIDPARIRQRFDARGSDIYDRTTVTRKVYSLSAKVRHGNSGGPLLTPDGEVAGVIFGKADGTDRTGYALTVAEIAGDAAAGALASTPVDTGSTCV